MVSMRTGVPASRSAAALRRDHSQPRQQRLKRVAGPHRPIDDVALDFARNRSDLELRLEQTAPFQYFRDQIARLAVQTSVQPVSGPPRRRIGPDV